MKWREVKILCAGMCVCTVIATGTAIVKNAKEKNQLAEAIEQDAMGLERTEKRLEAEVERHEVYEVGLGVGELTEATGSTFSLRGDDVEGSDDLLNEHAPQAEAGMLSEQQMVQESNLIIADVTNYVNIRSLPSEEGEILGKLYDNSVGRMHGEENGWYYIESGSVTGYVKGEFVLTGEDAENRAREVGTRLAEVTTTTLKVRKRATTDSAVLGLVPGGDILNVLEEVEGWVKVDVEDGPGYVSTDYVRVYTENVEAESKAEEAARLKKEEEERRRAEEAAKEALKQQQAANKPAGKPASGSLSGSNGGNASNSGSSSSTGGSTGSTSSESVKSLGQQIADYAMKFIGNPYVYGGTSLTNGADCSGFVQSVYKHFGISLPRHSGDQGKSGRAVDGLSNAKPGDLIWYSGHIGIYIGDGKIVHASNPKNGIIISNATYRKILGIRRIV
ncbi:MAG: C40 family peptidase [Roseburia sp.]|nr:C40 family peptidase [Roseburia sp.]